MTVTFRLLELNGTEWIDTREYPDDFSDSDIELELLQWAKTDQGISWWVEEENK